MTLSARDLAELLGGELRGNGEHRLTGAAALEAAGPTDLAFAADPKHLWLLGRSGAGAVLVPRDAPDLPEGRTLILVDHPQLAFARALRHLFPRLPEPAGIDPRAWVSPSARIDPTARVHAFAWVGERVVVGARTVLHPGVTLGEDVVVGEDCTLYPGVTVYPRSRLGRRVILHAGAVIGSDGYGFVWDGQEHFKIEQRGVAVLEDDVEVGAGCTIDRGALGETRIGRGTKLDNLVHVGHNVRIGEHCLLVAQVGIAGSTELGKAVVLGGQVGVAGHVRLADGVRVGGQGGVTKSLEKPGDYWGTPAREHQSWLRALASLSRLPALWETIRKLERRVDALERR
jgi:UDP-3-O-[3-hydroxymyristoyl] glucosamine N-acyltransferase